jgi:hypothetical protein
LVADRRGIFWGSRVKGKVYAMKEYGGVDI